MRCLDEHLLARLMERELDPVEQGAVEEHLAACDGCRLAVAELARDGDGSTEPGRRGATPSGSPSRWELPPGTQVGRFLVLEALGSGAMGRVYAAYDAELDRKVALKLLKPGGLTAEAERSAVFREARAMAKVAHPHVVAVHEVGTFGEHVFLAMELVEGATLRRWLPEAKPGWRQVVEVFAAAAEALAAAHRVGVVHRDFKPDNVLIDRAGRPRVTDFGLARVLEPGAAPRDSAGLLRSTAAGTPAYMAPEVMAGADADARADQFSLCVALYEALSGERPFEARSLDDLVRAIRVGPRPHRRVPGAVLRVLRRGLQPAPEARFAELGSLASQLRRVARPLPKLPFAIAAGVLALASGLGARHLEAAREVSACVGPAEALAPAWSAERRAAVQRAFEATQRPFAPFAQGRVAEALDGWGAEWHRTRRLACEARGHEALSGTLRCLDQHRAELAALTSVLAAADAAVVERSVAAAYALPRPARCLQPGATSEPARDAASQAALERSLELSAQANALLYAGRYAQGVVPAKESVRLAHASGDRRAEARALLTLAQLQSQSGAWDEAEESFERTIDVGLRQGLDAVSAEAWTRLAFMVGVNRGRAKEGWRLAERAAAAIAGSGGSARLEARLELARLGMHYDEGRLAQAVEAARRALALSVTALGAQHPEAITIRANLALTLAELHRGEEALEHAQAAHALTVEVFGPDDPRVANTTMALAGAHDALGDYPRAAELFRVALELRERRLGPDHPQLLGVLANHCLTAGVRLRQRDVVGECRRALTIAVRTTGAESRLTAETHFGLGRVLLALGEALEAHRELSAARQLYEKTVVEKNARLAELLVGEGEALEALGRVAPARAVIERAVAVAEQSADVLVLGSARFVLARLTWTVDAARALSLAEQARAELQRAGRGASVDLARLSEWLEAHRS